MEQLGRHSDIVTAVCNISCFIIVFVSAFSAFNSVRRDSALIYLA